VGSGAQVDLMNARRESGRDGPDESDNTVGVRSYGGKGDRVRVNLNKDCLARNKT